MPAHQATYQWFTVRSKKPRAPRPFQPDVRVFPAWITGSLQVAESHLLNRIVEEGKSGLRIYGFDGENWKAVA